MLTTELKHPLRHHEVSYDDSTHRYYVGDQVYTSATQLIERFKTPFDADKMSDWMVYRYGNTKQYWLDKWKQENSSSLVRGSNIHDRNERRLISKGYDLLPYPVPVQEFTPGIMYDLPDGVYPEMKLWRHDCRIAGRMDKGILRTDEYRISDALLYGTGLLGKECRFLDIDDYKTNKKIRTESFKGPDGYKMMTGPIAHLMDCELTHYTLQLSIYQYMGEYHGFVPGRRRIIWYPHPIPGVMRCGPQVKELPYLRNEVVAMVKTLVA